jgi:large subunit ribosomal protein L19
MKKIETIINPFLKKDVPNVRPGDTVKIFTIIAKKDEDKSEGKAGKKERIQAFEGVVLARKHGKEIGSTITVRKIVDGIGVEKIFPLHLPTIKKIEILRRSKVRRAKLYYLRTAKGKRGRLKRKEIKKEKPKKEKIVKKEVEKKAPEKTEKEKPQEKKEVKKETKE